MTAAGKRNRLETNDMTATETSLRGDFTQRATVRPGDEAWVWSPNREVQRLRLDRIGDEIARATSLVRYPPNSRFPTHTHGGGEEILVLDGEFSDESGDYAAGTYLRNPPGSAHAPFSEPGCLLLVKLWQFAPDDGEHLVVDTTRARWRAGPAAGVDTLPLHAHAGVRTVLERWAGGTTSRISAAPGGAEIYVVDGDLVEQAEPYPCGSWLRLPPGAVADFTAGADGALVYLKTGAVAAAEIPLPGSRPAP
jgi:anti-sigma factor ChrR (cupin superfamily)